MTRLFVVRHAEREKIEKQADVPKALLTIKGMNDARRLGALMRLKLGPERISIVTSKYNRCVQTGDFFAMGYGLDKIRSIETDHHNFLHTPFRASISNRQRLWHSSIFKHEIYGRTMRMWKTGRYDRILVSPFALLNVMMSLAEASNTGTMFIFAHDINVSAMGICNDMRALYCRKPAFLHGVYSENHNSRNWMIFSPEI